MSYAGSVLDMIKRIRANRELQKQNRDNLRRSKIANYKTVSNLKFNTEKYSKLTAEEIQQNKIKIQSELKKENLKTLVTLIIIIVLYLTIW